MYVGSALSVDEGAGAVGVDVHVEPDFAIVLPRQRENFPMPLQVGDLAGGTGEVHRIVDRLAVGEIADDEDHVSILGPDGLGERLELGRVFVVDAFFVAELDVRKPVGLGMSVGDALAAPFAVRRVPWRIR